MLIWGLRDRFFIEASAMFLTARSRMSDCSSVSVAAKNSSCFSGSRVLKEYAHPLSLMRFLLFIFLHFLLQVISCQKKEWKWLSLVFVLVWLRPSAGIWEQNHWDPSHWAELSTWVFHFVATLPRRSSPFTFCLPTDTWYKEKHLSLLCNENGSVLNLVLLEVKHYKNIPNIWNHLPGI